MQTKYSATVWPLLVSVVPGPSYFCLQNGLYFDTVGLSYDIVKANSHQIVQKWSSSRRQILASHFGFTSRAAVKLVTSAMDRKNDFN